MHRAPLPALPEDGAPRRSWADKGPDSDLSRIDLFAGARAFSKDEPSTQERLEEMALGLRHDEGAEAREDVVILEQGQRGAWMGRLVGELDGRRLAGAGSGDRPFVLERQEDGSLLYRGPGYRALIALDGSVRFASEDVVKTGLGPLVGDGKGAPGRGKGGGALEESVMRDALDRPVIPWVSGVFDLDRGLRAARDEDTLSAEKIAFLERTRALREKLRAERAPSPQDGGPSSRELEGQ